MIEGKLSLDPYRNIQGVWEQVPEAAKSRAGEVFCLVSQASLELAKFGNISPSGRELLSSSVARRRLSLARERYSNSLASLRYSAASPEVHISRISQLGHMAPDQLAQQISTIVAVIPDFRRVDRG